jgi:hypothetical protein
MVYIASRTALTLVMPLSWLTSASACACVAGSEEPSDAMAVARLVKLVTMTPCGLVGLQLLLQCLGVDVRLDLGDALLELLQCRVHGRQLALDLLQRA